MDSNSREGFDSKAEFRKPANDAANRKYRRRSPVGGSSSSSDGSPHRERSSSPVPSKKDTIRKDDARNQSGRSGESYKHSDRPSSRNYHRYDDHSKRDRHVDDYDRYSRSSYRSGRDPRDSNSLDHSRSDKEYRSRDRDRHREDRGDRYGKSDHRKSSRDYKGDYEECRGQRNDSSSRRDSSGHRKEGSVRDAKEQGNSESKEHSDDKSVKAHDSVAKKPKIFSPDSAGPAQDGTSEQTCVKDSDIDAAKIAAMKAAELVNKNLVGTGYMSTDQKKKLLWGNKKNTATEESAHRWDASTFGDRERQEKFNKLMGVKGETKVENKQGNPDMEKLQMDLEKQYTAGLRRRDGRTVGLGL